MEKKYNHKDVEAKIYRMWEEKELFKAKVDPKKKPYCIILPPPNASGEMHTGNVLMIAIEDLLIRWKRLMGYEVLWLPGTDHAGFETQTTYERKLAKQGKSRLDFDRQTLYNNIWDFVHENKSLIENQIRQMGASVDWSRYTFTLDPFSLKLVCDTFEKMHADGLIYRGDYVVNYSFKWGTTFSDAETSYKEVSDPLYYIRYRLSDNSPSPKGEQEIVIATVRPETIFIDTHIAVNPKDENHSHLIGCKALNPITGHEMEIIEGSFVDPAFGTGIVKLTPAHDKDDFQVALAQDLPIINIIDLQGLITQGPQKGMTIKKARKSAVEQLKDLERIEKIDESYKHMVPVDYRSGDYIENLVLPNWFVKVDGLRNAALESIKNGEMKIYPKWRQLTYVRWLENMHDWAISRQVVWGIRVPVWYDSSKNPNISVTFLDSGGQAVSGTLSEILGSYTLKEVLSGLQTLRAPKNSEYVISQESPGENYVPETDTFDTWFSSGQWPLITLKYPDSEDFKYFYPTSVLETGWEIVTRWISRMVMFGIYLTGKPPFADVYLHGHVRAIDGRKMSKSLGNHIIPSDYIEQYGADALRMGLILGTAMGRDFNFPQDKILAFRNFANKIWNMARFMGVLEDNYNQEEGKELTIYSIDELKSLLQPKDIEILVGFDAMLKYVDSSLKKYRFADAANSIYQFMWKDLASDYLEDAKGRLDKDVALSVLRSVYLECLKVLHPFMPFVTEEIWQNLTAEKERPLAVQSWPKPYKMS
ncbi:valine--tRNA ligase [Candidatus Nomurabacteria bacterium]|uniref:Valine--tRNA ligase n=1 Tax=candidate division WWE3 bacterium TaxID=2053526 RepID=A0A955IVP4_UNCKA|nr:valine--tRNA ligase [candidate division WWE3 bacterium]MCB9823542.1 valine--tRNA ligase [Candidatus Nomurabacteria bacterium]MCB9827337.1 valine--tRNA ligase [Candidatus Nomurabacteria bacterium]HXK52493.1 valine--tRNA ligase [bacterium]